MMGRLCDLRRLWDSYQNNVEDADLGTLCDYGLSFDYVAPGTFGDQKEGYFRYQLSWGGPSDEFRFFVNPDLSCHRVEYWLLDWFDGANRVLTDADEAFVLELWEWFRDSGAVSAALKA
jgi:hypothetical protein